MAFRVVRFSAGIAWEDVSGTGTRGHGNKCETDALAAPGNGSNRCQDWRSWG